MLPIDPYIKPIVIAAGGPTALAEALQIRVPSLYNWKTIPENRIVKVASMAAARGWTAERIRAHLAARPPKPAPPARVKCPTCGSLYRPRKDP